MQTEDKLRGGYYTPKEITDFIAKIIFESKNKFIKGLEPGVGDGAFFESLAKYDYEFQFTGIELDSNEAEKAKKAYEYDNRFKIINEDFYNIYHTNRENKYDVVVGNPPYIRYQYLTETQREYQSEILLNNGQKSNKLINAWVAFTVASIEVLRDGGMLAFVLPTDLLQVSYAKSLRNHFKTVFHELTMINIKESAFDEIQQDILLVIGTKKQENEKHKLRIINIENSSQLKNLNISEFPTESNESIDRFYQQDKWTTAFIGRDEQKFYFDLEENKNISRFNNYIKGEVGITTGNNKLFAVNDQVVQKFDLNEYKVPLLGRSVEAAGIIYQEDDLHYNKENDKNIWLLDFNDKNLNTGAKEYIRLAEENGETNGYKLSLRDKWYEVPSVWIPDAFLLRRMGSHPKVVANCINATSTDTFHRLKLYNEVNVKKIIFSLYSSLTLMTFELEGRVFGGGALEILPGDLTNISIPNLNFYSKKTDYEALFSQLDNKFRNNEKITDIVLWVDNVLIEKGFDSTILSQTYKIWKKERQRRIDK